MWANLNIPSRVSRLMVFFLIGVSLTLSAAEREELKSYTKNNRFLVTLEIHQPVQQINTEIPAVLVIKDKDGKTVRPRKITISGGMESHGHGLSTKPSVDKFLGDGRWQVSGLEFSMRGPWQLTVQILDAQGWDYIRFDMSVGEPDEGDASSTFSKRDIKLLKTLTIASLPPSKDDTNPVLHNVLAATAGLQLFFDENLSKNHKVSCGTCHKPELSFTDGKELGEGIKPLSANVPTIIGAAHQRWFYSDGRRDSLWSQSITPIEAPEEMDLPRSDVLRYFFSVSEYRDTYRKLFGNLPNLTHLKRNATPMGSSEEKRLWKQMPVKSRRAYNQAFANIGRLLAAYIASIEISPTRFDRFVQSLQSKQKSKEVIYSNQEILGLKTFINSKNRCLSCHNGPTFSNKQFHNIGTRRPADLGRQAGAQAVLIDPFNCQGRYSGVSRDKCYNLKHLASFNATYYSAGGYKTPTLRNISSTAPYMHDGSLQDLKAVVEHYQTPPKQQSHELQELQLTDSEVDALVAFLKTL